MKYLIDEQTLVDLADVIRYKADINETLTPSEMIEAIDGLTTTTEKPFNFEIVGGATEPTNPIENMIWINTDIEIGEYQFSATEPTMRADGTELQNGDVWISTRNYAGVYVNALKKNGIQLQMSACEQFNGTSWESKEIKIYQNSEWKDIDLIIFNGETVKNGYSFVTTKYSSTAVVVATPTVANGVVNSNYKSTATYLRLNEKVDLTNKSTIEAIISFPDSFGGVTTARFVVTKTIGGEVSSNEMVAAVALSTSTKETQSVNIDVSALTGEYYIGCYAYSEASNIGINFHYLKIY